jgi:glucokinase
MLLAGDIGGTKTSLAIFSPEAGPRAPLVEATFPSADYPSLEAVVRKFLARVDLEVGQASFGVAGPVVGGRAEITNLPWVIEESQLREALYLSSVRLLNDLEAIAHAVPILSPADLHTLSEGQPAPGGAIAVIAPGTGLGEAYLTWDGSRYCPRASEGGHASFAPTTPLQVELLRYLQDRLEHVSYERVCSGQGISNIYAFLKDSGRAAEPAWLAERLTAADDPAPVIANAALNTERPCELCISTLDTFISILGAEAGNLALKVLATGGVYLGGGIPPRILPALEQGQFMGAFQRKGRLSDLLACMPVHVILNPEAALLGTACYGLELYGVSRLTNRTG